MSHTYVLFIVQAEEKLPFTLPGINSVNREEKWSLLSVELGPLVPSVFLSILSGPIFRQVDRRKSVVNRSEVANVNWCICEWVGKKGVFLSISSMLLRSGAIETKEEPSK